MNANFLTVPYREIGDVPFEVWAKEMANYPSSPLIPIAPALYAICKGHTALALAHMKRESSFETDRLLLSPADHNPFNLKVNGSERPPGMTGTKPEAHLINGDPYLTFESPLFAAREWLRRITDPTYVRVRWVDGVRWEYRYRPDMTLKEYSDTFAEPGDAHSVTGDANETYADDMVTMLTRFVATEAALSKEPEMAKYPVALGGGKTAMIESLVPIKQAIIPASQTNQRPGYLIDADYWCQHENGNPSHDAADEERYFRLGAEGRQASYHFVGDSEVIYQLLPLNENGWHAGDSWGPGNMKSIAGSIAQGAKDMAKARKVMEHLAAGVMAALNIPAGNTRQHYDFAPNRKDCPQWIRRDGYWPTFQSNVKRLVAAIVGGVAQPDPVKYATPIQLAPLDITAAVAPAMVVLNDKDKTECIWVGDRVRAIRDTRRRQWAGENAPDIGPVIPKDIEFDVDWLLKNSEGWWYYTPYDTRVKADDCERISDAKAAA
jgi:hypothetical protein